MPDDKDDDVMPDPLEDDEVILPHKKNPLDPDIDEDDEVDEEDEEVFDPSDM